MSAFPYTPATVPELRHKLDAILASGDFPQAKPPGLWQRIWDEFLRWFLKILASVMPGTPSHTALLALELTVIAVPCGLLIWWLIRRLRLQSLDLPQEGGPHPSALAWQKWLEQGQELGRSARWREAIHHVYWSAISCLESRDSWPADRALTPREYLTLVADKPVRTDLLSLTRSFERTWYGDQPAGKKEFDEACRELERIVAP
jgi:hypothetical protein